MAGERTKRPTLVLAAWSTLLLGLFVARGDLRIGAAPVAAERPPERAADGPVVVRAESATRRPARAESTCKGRVIDGLGFLVVGAEVQAAERGVIRTDADGEFRLELPPEALLEVVVRAKGLQPRRLRLTATTPDAILVQLVPEAPWDEEQAPLPPAPAIVGEGVVRTENGQPVAGAWVTAIGGVVWSRTDEIGRYSLPLPAPPVTLVVHRPDANGESPGLAARTEPIEVGRAQGRVPLPEIVAAPAGAIRGVVRDARGAPIEGAPVQVRGEGIARVFETGPGGMFRIGGLHRGRYVVRPFAYRGALGLPHEIDLSGAVVDCDLHLQSAAERRLRLLDERGAPVGRAYVATSLAGERNSVALTDADGWAAVTVCDSVPADEAMFEVRTGEAYEPAAVRSYDAGSATLVVGAR